jgi:hypothetical protein
LPSRDRGVSIKDKDKEEDKEEHILIEVPQKLHLISVSINVLFTVSDTIAIFLEHDLQQIPTLLS